MRFDPIAVGNRLVAIAPPNWRPLLRGAGVAMSWVLLIESFMSLVIGRAFVRDAAVWLYRQSAPITQAIFEIAWSIVAVGLDAWRLLVHVPLEVIFGFININLPVWVYDASILSIFLLRAYMKYRRAREPGQILKNGIGYLERVDRYHGLVESLEFTPTEYNKIIEAVSRIQPDSDLFNEHHKALNHLRQAYRSFWPMGAAPQKRRAHSYALEPADPLVQAESEERGRPPAENGRYRLQLGVVLLKRQKKRYDRRANELLFVVVVLSFFSILFVLIDFAYIMAT